MVQLNSLIGILPLQGVKSSARSSEPNIFIRLSSRGRQSLEGSTKPNVFAAPPKINHEVEEKLGQKIRRGWGCSRWGGVNISLENSNYNEMVMKNANVFIFYCFHFTHLNKDVKGCVINEWSSIIESLNTPKSKCEKRSFVQVLVHIQLIFLRNKM